MKKKRICMALAAALSLSLAVSATALAAIPSDIGGHWAQGTIIQWTTNGYIAGYPDGTFKPDNSITRAEFVVMVNKAMGYNKRGNAYFSDVSAAHWAYAEIMKGVEAGYITGNGDGTFRPDAPVTRQEAAVMISKILGLDQDYASAAKYVDYRYIPSWAAGYVGAVSKAGIMTGYPDGDFKSDRVLTRAESVVSLDKTKNYDGKVEEDKDDREVFEDYRLTSSSLSDKIIKGDLIISSSLSNRNVSLDNVKVEGKLIVEGGKTVTADDCEISELEMNRSDVEFDATGRTKVGKTTFEKYGKLSGSGYSRVIIDDEFNSYIELNANIDYVELDADTNVRLLENCAIETFEATKNADSATVNFNKAEVEDMDIYDAIRITGRGDINNMTVYKSGVKSSIRPDHLDRRNGASKPDYTSTSSGDVGYNPGSRYDDLTASRDNKTYSGGRYDDVKVTGEDVNLKNMTIYGNLTIDEDVRNSDIELRDLDIRGNVYIYGGGQSTVGFYDCEIEGNIYARKDYDNTPVGLYIDGDTVENFDGDLYIDDDGAILENGGKLDKVYVLTKSKVEIDTDVKNLYVNAKTDNLTITSGTTVDKLSISSSSVKGSTITNNGTIKELNTSQDITVNGGGTINNPTGNGTVTAGNGQKISVKGVSLNATTATVEAGNKYQLTATVQPTNATNNKVTWSSDKTDIATVDENGLVTAKAAGTANITVTTEDGSKTATCTVTVNPETVAVESISLSESSFSLEEDEIATLTATVTPYTATDKTVTWESSAPEYVSVTPIQDENGKATITALKTTNTENPVTITAKAGDKTATCTVTVTAKTVEVESVTITGTGVTGETEKTATMTAGENLQLTAKVEPAEATNKAVNWNSSATEVATVQSNGDGTATVTAKASGTATITATAVGGTNITDSITVTVNPALTGIKLEPATATLEGVGTTTTITATAIPEGAELGTVTWSIITPGIVDLERTEVNSAIVKAVSVGTTTIKAEVDGKVATCEIKVEIPVESVSISASGGTQGGTSENPAIMTSGGTLQLMATVEPDNATNSDVTWSSNTPTVATVDSSTGLVTAGSVTESKTVTITATVGGKSATFTITVNPAAVPGTDSGTTTPGGVTDTTSGPDTETGTENQPVTGGGSQTPGKTTTTTQATSNAIVVSR